MSLILNIDSSLQEASVSIASDGNVLQCLSNDIQKDHASFLHLAIKQLLSQQGITAQQLDAIAVTAGPGSYTGLRVGFSAAKGLSYALDKPLISIGTLPLLAKAAMMNNGENEGYYYCPMIDARRMEVYTGLYDANNEEIIPPHAEVLTESSFGFELADKKIFFFGDGMEKWRNISTSKNSYFLEVGKTVNPLAFLSNKSYIQQTFVDISISVPLYTKEFFKYSNKM